MAKRWRIKPNKNLRDNARLVVPIMVDDFLALKERVLGHPRLKNELHRMRLAGKTLRYAMEVFEPAFGKEFESCLEEVKLLLDTMGKIHDCDVHIPKLQTSLREIRLFNRATSIAGDRVATGSMLALMQEQRALRNSLFVQMTAHVERWTRENFKAELLQAMIVPSKSGNIA